MSARKEIDMSVGTRPGDLLTNPSDEGCNLLEISITSMFIDQMTFSLCTYSNGKTEIGEFFCVKHSEYLVEM